MAEITIPILARIEGERALQLQIHQGKIENLQLRIYEPPRLFEKFLEGRDYDEVLDLVARICGICPVAYQMSAVHAIEEIFAINPGPWVREMRRLFYCGEWMESHSLHIHLLAAPDFLGYSTAFEMAKDHPNEVKRGLYLQGLGNKIIKLLGARSVHPVGACVGGFFRAPPLSEVTYLLQQLEKGLKEADNLIQWTAALSLADSSHDFTCVSLCHPDEYPLNEGNIVADNGLNITRDKFEDYFKEYQVPYSNALQCTLNNESYLVGPLARVNINYEKLPLAIHKLLKKSKIKFPSKNMFHSIVARAVEIRYCLGEAIRILKNYTYPKASRVTVIPKAGIGYGCTEAPRGLLWQRYELDAQGLVKTSRIVPPTSQNQARIEEDLYHTLTNFGLERSNDELRLQSEMVIRNYDPCISCSTHFLDLRVERS